MKEAISNPSGGDFVYLGALPLVGKPEERESIWGGVGIEGFEDSAGVVDTEDEADAGCSGEHEDSSGVSRPIRHSIHIFERLLGLIGSSPYLKLKFKTFVFCTSPHHSREGPYGASRCA